MRARPLLSPRSCAVLLLALCLTWTYITWPHFALACTSRSWPRTSSRIVASDLVPDGNKYAVRVLYEYDVSGNRYLGSNHDALGIYRGFHFRPLLVLCSFLFLWTFF